MGGEGEESRSVQCRSGNSNPAIQRRPTLDQETFTVQGLPQPLGTSGFRWPILATASLPFSHSSPQLKAPQSCPDSMLWNQRWGVTGPRWMQSSRAPRTASLGTEAQVRVLPRATNRRQLSSRSMVSFETIRKNQGPRGSNITQKAGGRAHMAPEQVVEYQVSHGQGHGSSHGR